MAALDRISDRVIRCIFLLSLFQIGTCSTSFAQSTTEAELVGYSRRVSGRPELFDRPISYRSGLQSRNSVSMTVEAIYGKLDDSDELIGSPDAPQIFGTHFYAANLGVLDGEHVGDPSLDPAIVGQQLNNDATIGMRASLNYRSPNSAGLEVSGFWLGDSERSWQRGLGGFDAGSDPNNLRATTALPLFDGGSGYAVPFDQYFRIGLTTDLYGIGVDYAAETYWIGATLVQPTIGVRYLDMDEQFQFRGADSGLSYTLNSTGTLVVDPANPPTAAFPPYQSSLDAAAHNRLLGPSLGLNVATSGRRVRFNSKSRVGVFVADTSQTLSGKGLGDGFAAGFDPTIAFSDTLNHRYATPFVEQTLGVDIELLPGARRGERDNSLALRLGWTFMAINSVTRPTESIVWNGFPLTPELKKTKTDWALQTWNFGLVFQY